MNDRLRRRHRTVAVLVGLALTASISVVAPATASAREVGARSTGAVTVQQLQHPSTKAPSRNVNIWEW